MGDRTAGEFACSWTARRGDRVRCPDKPRSVTPVATNGRVTQKLSIR